MSTPFYDLASLVVVPSGYKASKVYAQKPLTTDGQLSFGRASTATRVNSAGLIETVSSNVPRLDYLGSTCPKLQLEPQRSNIILYSSNYTVGAWTKNAGATVTANTVTSPDGTTNATTLTVSTSFYSGLYQAISGSTAVHTVSIFAKKGTKNWLYLFDATASGQVWFNLNTGTLGTVQAGRIATIENYGNGWYRCSVTMTAGGSIAYMQLGLSDGDGFSQPTSTGTAYLWGAQVEAGAYSTSLIPTTSAVVTRLADACNKTGVSSFFGSASGTFYMEFTYTAKNVEYGDYLFDISDSANTNRFLSFSTGPAYTNKDTYVLYDTAIAGFANYDFYHNQRYKIAVVYDSTSTRWYINGVLVGTGGSFGYQMSQIYLFSRYSLNGITKGDIHQIMTFNTAQSNAKAIELTTL